MNHATSGSLPGQTTLGADGVPSARSFGLGQGSGSFLRVPLAPVFPPYGSSRAVKYTAQPWGSKGS